MTQNYYIKWMHIVLENKTTQLKEIAQEIGDLNHQIRNYESMGCLVQEEVRNELKRHMLKLGWKKEVDELFRSD